MIKMTTRTLRSMKRISSCTQCGLRQECHRANTGRTALISKLQRAKAPGRRDRRSCRLIWAPVQ
jgi:hypothetical protein